MTGSSAKPRGKRFLRCVLNTFRWVNHLGNLCENRRNRHETSTTADGETAALENDRRIRKPALNAELLGKYRFLFLTFFELIPLNDLRQRWASNVFRIMPCWPRAPGH